MCQALEGGTMHCKTLPLSSWAKALSLTLDSCRFWRICWAQIYRCPTMVKRIKTSLSSASNPWALLVIAHPKRFWLVRAGPKLLFLWCGCFGFVGENSNLHSILSSILWMCTLVMSLKFSCSEHWRFLTKPEVGFGWGGWDEEDLINLFEQFTSWTIFLGKLSPNG